MAYQTLAPASPVPFGTGDGVTTQFALTDGDENILSTTISLLLENDWRGPISLYTTPRANQLAASQAIGGLGTPWALGNTTVLTSAALAPDGSMTATLLQETAVTNYFSAYQAALISPYSINTASIFLQAATRTAAYVEFLDGGGNGFIINVDLSAGVIASSGVNGTGVLLGSTITPYPGGWYRVSVSGQTGNNSGTGSFFVGPENPVGTSNYAGTAGLGIYVWGAQLEPGAVMTPYIVSTTYPQVTVDYSITSLAPRTNLLPFSNTLSNAVWGTSNSTITAATTLLTPDQNYNAWKVTVGTGNNYINNNAATTALAGRTVCASVWLNIGTYNPTASSYVRLWVRDGAENNVGWADFDFVNLVPIPGFGTLVPPSMVSYGNGWFRLSVSCTFPPGATAGLHFYIDPAEGVAETGNYYYVYNPQVEYGVYPTAAIVTLGLSPVTVVGTAASIGEGIVLFQVPPVVGAQLYWQGTIIYIYNAAGGAPPLWEQTILSQYANSPILLALIASLNAAINPAVNINSFYANIWNIVTAQGYGLDVWGRIVGVSRLLNVGTATYFGFENASGPFNASGDSWGGGPSPTGANPWYSGEAATGSFALGDQAYRTLILAKAFANVCNSSVPAINQLLINLFIKPVPGRTGSFSCTDNLNMTMAYTSSLRPVLTPVEVAIVSQSGVLPRPTGVSTQLVQI